MTFCTEKEDLEKVVKKYFQKTSYSDEQTDNIALNGFQKIFLIK